MTWLHEMYGGLTLPQKQVIRDFIRSFAQSEPYYSNAIRARAMRYWLEET